MIVPWTGGRDGADGEPVAVSSAQEEAATLRYACLTPLPCGMLGTLALVVAVCADTASEEAGAPAAARQAPRQTATAQPASAPRPAATASGAVPADQKAQAVELLGAAVSARAEGDLGIALELARQAQGLWPAYAGARAFIAEVAPQATAAAREAIAQATAAAQESRRQTTAQAQAAEAARAAQACVEFQTAVRSIDPRSVYINAVGCEGLTVRVVVGTRWHSEPYQVRKQMAQAIWQAWASLAAPEHPDRARLHLRALMGNDVGGSSWLAGSPVDVTRERAGRPVVHERGAIGATRWRAARRQGAVQQDDPRDPGPDRGRRARRRDRDCPGTRTGSAAIQWLPGAAAALERAGAAAPARGRAGRAISHAVREQEEGGRPGRRDRRCRRARGARLADRRRGACGGRPGDARARKRRSRQRRLRPVLRGWGAGRRGRSEAPDC